MLKKLVLLLSTIVLSLILTANCFAYTNMYTPTSGIPDFSEVTGARLINKTYFGVGTVYEYDIVTSNEAFHRFLNILADNGYINYMRTEGPDRVINGFLNVNKNLEVDISLSANYYNNEYIIIGIKPFY